MRAGKLIIALNLLLSLGACSLFIPGVVWPKELPPQQYFVDYYESSEDNHEHQNLQDYLGWVRVFYQGNTLSPGWLYLTDELLLETDASRQAEYSELMGELGLKISAEWAQNNAVRLIDTRCAGIWRNALLEAIARDDMENYIRRFEADVDALLEGSLRKDEISPSRYYEEEEFEFL